VNSKRLRVDHLIQLNKVRQEVPPILPPVFLHFLKVRKAVRTVLSDEYMWLQPLPKLTDNYRSQESAHYQEVLNMSSALSSGEGKEHNLHAIRVFLRKESRELNAPLRPEQVEAYALKLLPYCDLEVHDAQLIVENGEITRCRIRLL